MQRKTLGNHPGHHDSKKKALLEARVLELEASLKDAGVFSLFPEPRMLSMRLPNRPHPVACSFVQPPGGHGAIIFDLQIGGLSSRALAIAGLTTMEEAEIIGTTLTFGPLVKLDEYENRIGPISNSYSEMLEDALRQREGRPGSSGRRPGKAPHDPEADELETLGFAFQGILEASRATCLSPSDVWETPREILEIRVSGSTEGLALGEKAKVSWEHVPFEPIQMAPFPAARLHRSLRRRPLRGKQSWILHIVPMNISDASTHDTFQVLFALDARSGKIVGQESAMDGTADSIGRALESILQEAGYRPGSAITTSPRLDDILGEALQGLGIRYARRKRLKASDPRVQDLEEFMHWAEPRMMADMIEDGGTAP